ncbi:MAG: glycosyltransferase family 4 protein [Planctomycetota bacterium]|nr:glycosyltransferase family 4 protein [Planctomycetota bacterium]
MDRPRIVHLSSVHRAFDTRIFYREAKSIAKAGYDMVLILPHERDEVVDGVRIVAIPRPSGRRERMTRTAWQVYRRALKERAALYQFHDPEMIPVGILLKLSGKRVIYDVHECVKDSTLNKMYISPLFRKPIAWAARLAEIVGTAFFDAIVAATPTIARQFPPARTTLVRNFPSSQDLPVADFVPFAQRSLRAIYAGCIDELYGLRQMIDAAALLPAMPQAAVTLCGSFDSPETEARGRQLPGWNRVSFLGFQNRARLAALFAQAQAGLIVIPPAPNSIDSMPNKLFEYMAAGLPVVASDFPQWREIIDGCHCGLLVDPQNPQAIADAIQWLLDHRQEAEEMGGRGRQAVQAKYNWQQEEGKLLSLYERILGRRGHGSCAG